MKRYPKFVLYLDRVAENASKVMEFCAPRGIEVCAVSKGISADPHVAGAMVEGGCRSFSDSRVANLEVLKKHFPDIPRTLLRIPMKSELKDIIRVADCSLVSMKESVEALSAMCVSENTTHKVILMFDLGDRREGILDYPGDKEDEMAAFVEVFKKTPRVTLHGVGVNFGCFADTLPSAAALHRLCLARETMEKELGYPVPLCSGGSTSSLALMERGELPGGVNHLRIGEAILLGQDITWQRTIPWLRSDTAHLEAEIVEALVKPSLPEGNTGADAFGNKPSFENEGEQLRVIAAIGRQDVRLEGISPAHKGLRILGGSGDHTVIAVDDSSIRPRWGDILRFSVNYAAMLALMTSPYVFKEYRYTKSKL
jgi:predicted amino acid racemase